MTTGHLAYVEKMVYAWGLGDQRLIGTRRTMPMSPSRRHSLPNLLAESMMYVRPPCDASVNLTEDVNFATALKIPYAQLVAQGW